MDDGTRNIIGALFGTGAIMFTGGLWMRFFAAMDHDTGGREKAFFTATAINGAIWLTLAGVLFFFAHIRWA